MKKERKKILYELYASRTGRNMQSSTAENVCEDIVMPVREKVHVNVFDIAAQTVLFVLKIIILIMAGIGLTAVWYPPTRSLLIQLIVR